jgi:magnesium-transporting ATPase (P-type)
MWKAGDGDTIRGVRHQWHATSRADTLAALETRPEGLSAVEARERLARDGPNRLPTAAGPSPARLLLDQVRTPLIGALIAAGVLAFALGEAEDGIVVLAVVALNALIGFVSEYRAAVLGIAAADVHARVGRRAPPRCRT